MISPQASISGLQRGKEAARLESFSFSGIVNTSQGYGNQSLTGGNAASATLGTKEATRNSTLAPTQAFYGGAIAAAKVSVSCPTW